MDYKKKYKQLHTLISDLYPFMSEYCKEKVEGFFPELAGSKDERIRKALLEMVHDTTGDELWIDYNVHKEEVLAWLEKQGEVESDNDDIEIEEKGIREAFNKIEDEKQGEQKPAIEMKSAEESLGIDSETYNKIVDECIYSEQKSQRMISAEAKEAMYAKTAWSEEDEKRLSDAIFFVREYQIPTRDKRLLNAAKEAENWLKSLKTRYTWKPSDEQMADLWNMLCECRPADLQLLLDIYYGLKKLRGDKL